MTPDRSAKIKSLIRVASGNHDYRIVLHYNGVHTDLRSSSASAYKSEQPHGSLCVGVSNFFWLRNMGSLSDRIGRRPLLIACTLLVLVTAYPALAWLTGNPSFSRLLVVELWLSWGVARVRGRVRACCHPRFLEKTLAYLPIRCLGDG
jgi:hypothetical protein